MELPPAPVPPNVVVGDRPRRAVDYDDSEPDDDEEDESERKKLFLRSVLENED